ncbi:MAG TPA: TonB family protein [Steroidobacteraceae bacterium]
MAVQILNDMPDVAVHRGEPVSNSLSDWSPRTTRANTRKNRPLFIGVTIAVHVVAIIGFMSVRHVTRSEQPPTPIIAEIFEAPRSADEAPPLAPPPMQEVVYSLPTPDVVSIDIESITPPPVTANTITPASMQTAEPPMVETVEYVRAPAPVYPRESSRRREFGTVLLRVVVDSDGHAAQIRVERSSGYERLDVAARQAVEKALFRPYVVNGIRQTAQVLIPIEFMRRAS